MSGPARQTSVSELVPPDEDASDLGAAALAAVLVRRDHKEIDTAAPDGLDPGDDLHGSADLAGSKVGELDGATGPPDHGTGVRSVLGCQL